jgi:hypothetical protein
VKDAASVTGELDIQEVFFMGSMVYLQARPFIPEPRSKKIPILAPI